MEDRKRTNYEDEDEEGLKKTWRDGADENGDNLLLLPPQPVCMFGK